MALKAIGDMGNKEAIDFLLQERKKWASQTTNEAVWNTTIIDLYVY